MVFPPYKYIKKKKTSDKLVQPGNFPFKKNLNIGQKLNKNVNDLKMGEPVLVIQIAMTASKLFWTNTSIAIKLEKHGNEYY